MKREIATKKKEALKTTAQTVQTAEKETYIGQRGRKKGCAKTGGRVKGTPNRVTALAKELVTKWLETHNTINLQTSESLLIEDFKKLEPRDRVRVTCEFIKLITPKQINIDDNSQVLTIEAQLIALSQHTEDDAL